MLGNVMVIRCSKTVLCWWLSKSCFKAIKSRKKTVESRYLRVCPVTRQLRTWPRSRIRNTRKAILSISSQRLKKLFLTSLFPFRPITAWVTATSRSAWVTITSRLGRTRWKKAPSGAGARKFYRQARQETCTFIEKTEAWRNLSMRNDLLRLRNLRRIGFHSSQKSRSPSTSRSWSLLKSRKKSQRLSQCLIKTIRMRSFSSNPCDWRSWPGKTS